MNLKSTVIFLLVTMSFALSGEVFDFNEQESLLNIFLLGSLDLYNAKYNEDNIVPFTEKEIESLNIDDIVFFDKWLVRDYDSDLADISTYFTLGGLGATMYYSVYDTPHTWKNFVVLSEVLVAQATVNHWTKSLTTRTRPYAYIDKTPMDMKIDVEAKLSFYSFHTSTAFATAVYNHYYQVHSGNPSSNSIWANYLIASSVALLRVGSGKHFLSDVLVGAASGSSISYLICKLRSKRTPVTLTIDDNYIGLNIDY